MMYTRTHIVNIIAEDGSHIYITIKLSLAITTLNKILSASRLQGSVS